jgi:hypothetical protein
MKTEGERESVCAKRNARPRAVSNRQFGNLAARVRPRDTEQKDLEKVRSSNHRKERRDRAYDFKYKTVYHQPRAACESI